MSTLVIQFLGVLAAFFCVISFQTRSNKALYLCQLVANLMFAIHFLGMGATSGCFNLIATLLRNFLLGKADNWPWVKQKWVPALLIIISLSTTAITWENTFSLLPFIAVAGSIIGYWTDNAQKIRLSTLLCAAPCWLIYDISIGSMGGILNEIFILLSILLSIYKHGWKSLGENKFS